jgi:nucleoside-diphosphate-sugar epimerase
MGAEGFLGRQITELFQSQGWEVSSLSRRPELEMINGAYFSNLFDANSLREVIRTIKPDVVLSTAWYTAHGEFWNHLSNLAYRDATLAFAEICFELGVKTFIGIGTMSEYGVSPGICNSEFSVTNPSDVYSKSKLETGISLKRIGEKYGRQTHWARIFQAFGPNEKRERFVPSLITNLGKGMNFPIRTPNNVMDWIHSEDVASAIYFALVNELGHFVDIGTGVATSVKSFAELICSELELDHSLLDFTKQILDHKKFVVADTKTPLFERGWFPRASLADRIKSLR